MIKSSNFSMNYINFTMIDTYERLAAWGVGGEPTDIERGFFFVSSCSSAARAALTPKAENVQDLP